MRYTGLFKRYFAAALLCTPALLTACSQHREDPREKSAETLYRDLCKLTRLYTDSIKAAPDSMVNTLFDRYNKEFDRISFDVTPDTDFFMNEGENDSIYMLQRHLLDIIAKRNLHPVDSIPPAPVDSLAVDSVAQQIQK